MAKERLEVQVNKKFEFADPNKVLSEISAMAKHSRDMKHDYDKPAMQLLPLDALREVAKTLSYGAKKYQAHSWKTVDNAKERYMGALLRHLTDYSLGKQIDKESGLMHIAQVAANALFLVWFELNKT